MALTLTGATKCGGSPDKAQPHPGTPRSRCRLPGLRRRGGSPDKATTPPGTPPVALPLTGATKARW
ncbi:hypothetical protein ACP3S7_04765 [Phytobacter ursingii]